ncbi:MAG: acyl-CoA carboxylase subunit epsilon [Galbitalea sp.]
MSDGPQSSDERGAETAPPRPDIAVLAGNPDDLELAAVTAVLETVLEELAEEHGRRESATPSAWERSQRTVRAPLNPGPGAWRSFSG